MDRKSDIEHVRGIYCEALQKGDNVEASSAISRGLALGVPLRSLYLDIIVPAQVAIDDCWAAGDIGIADEHAATQIAFSEMERLRGLIQPRQCVERSALVTSIEGDSHSVGGRAAADFLIMDGWDVFFLGADTPVAEIVNFAQSHHVDLICISVTLHELLPRAAIAAQGVRGLAHSPKVILSGPRSIMTSDKAKGISVDAFTTDALQLVREARAVTGLAEAESALSMFLKALGSRLQGYRKSREMNQQELADRAGLDRAYISSLENGKQNLTVGAVSKLAEALGVSIEELLVGKSGSESVRAGAQAQL